MNELHESIIGQIIVPNEGQRELLCSNNSPTRCPSLSPSSYTLSQETVDALSELGEVIRGIRKRLMAEGYEIKDGKIYKHGILQQN